MKFTQFILLALLLSSSTIFAKPDPCVFSLIDFGPGYGIWIIPDDPGCGGGISLMSYLNHFLGL